MKMGSQQSVARTVVSVPRHRRVATRSGFRLVSTLSSSRPFGGPNVQARRLLLLMLLAGLASAILVAPVAGAAPYEPNDTIQQAYGPIGVAGGLHTIQAAGETTNDDDWYFFYVPSGSSQVVAQLSSSNEPYTRVALVAPDGSQLYSVVANSNDPTSGQLAYTVTGPGKFYLHFDCDGECDNLPVQYTLTLQGDWPATDPTPPPRPVNGTGDPVITPTPTRECLAARSRVARLTRSLVAAKRAYRVHPTRKRANRVIRVRSTLRVARRTRTVECG